MATTFPEHFERQYQSHLKHLKLKGPRPKTIEAYARGMRRRGEYCSYRVDALSQEDLAEYFTDLLGAHSWSGVKLDLYGWKFFTEHVLRKPWAMPNFIRPPKVSRLPDIVSVAEAQALFAATRVLSYRVFFFTLYSLGLRPHQRADGRLRAALGDGAVIALAQLIEPFEPALLQRYGDRLLPSHRQALAAMKRCRTAFAARMLAQCTGCGDQRSVPHSCGHRSCPHCQHHEAQVWIERQTQLLVPATCFMLTFTLPAELRGLAWGHQRVVYALLMQCAWDTLATFSRNDARFGATPGAVGVLHTHSRRRCDAHGRLSFQYRDSATGKMARRTLPGEDFLWLLLQHVLPKGLRRCRNFGFLHPNSAGALRLLQLLHVRAAPQVRPAATTAARPAWRCACGQPMIVLRRRMPAPMCGSSAMHPRAGGVAVLRPTERPSLTPEFSSI